MEEALLPGAHPLVLIGECVSKSRRGAAAVVKILGQKINRKIQSNPIKIDLQT